VVVTSSGSLGHVYFAQVPERLSLEQIAAAYPGLIERLVAHEGIEFVLVRSEARGAVVMGKRGIRALDADRAAEGEDPLAPFSPHTAGFLRRLAGYSNAGDIVVNGAYDTSTGQVIGIDDLVGAHGGVGGMQTRPFLAYPSVWTERDPELVGAASVHRFLRRHALGEDAVPAPDGVPARAAAESGDRRA
jgi:putative membrane protein